MCDSFSMCPVYLRVTGRGLNFILDLGQTLFGVNSIQIGNDPV